MSTALVMVVVPAVASLLALLLGGSSRRVAATLAVAGPLGALVLAVDLASRSPWDAPVTDDGFGGVLQPFPAATVVDGLAVSVALMVAFVATLVQVYSIGYMRDEPRYASYSAFISLFTAAMLAVVVAGDLLLLVVGWEVMGLCSYLLIGQHWEQQEARRAAVKAFLVTKVGDIGFIVGIVVLIGATGSLLLPNAIQAGAADPTVAMVVSPLLLLGVLGKSAQFPLHAWLPDAMAGPSPVSALIHAATMVAAGVYVVARVYPIFLAVPEVLTAMALIACVTMLGAAVLAVVQTELKRVLAWSTVSQLAYMVAALAVGSRDAAVFHLLTHAFFKALLFLSAGAVIHAVGSGQLRDLGGLRRAMPVTFATMSVGLLALVGVFPLAGFFSKESVLVAAEHAAQGDAEVASWVGWLVLIVAAATIAVTAVYAVRLWVLTWGGPRREAHEAPATMTAPLLLLAVPSAAFGVLALEASWLPTWITAGATQPTGSPEALTPELLTVVVSVAAIVVGVLGFLAVRRRLLDTAAQPLLTGGFGVDAAYRVLVVRPFERLVRLTSVVDTSVIGQGVTAVGDGVVAAGRAAQQAQRGDVQRYLSVAAAATLAAVVVMLVAVAT